MNEQETVDLFAELAKARLTDLLRLKSVKHVYEPSPGVLNSKLIVDHLPVVLDKLSRGSQPYKDIGRFVSAEKIMQYIIDPGLLPIAKSISKDILGKQLLVTRELAVKAGVKGSLASVDGFGVRIAMYFDEDTQDTIVKWDCLYGVA